MKKYINLCQTEEIIYLCYSYLHSTDLSWNALLHERQKISSIVVPLMIHFFNQVKTVQKWAFTEKHEFFFFPVQEVVFKF